MSNDSDWLASFRRRWTNARGKTRSKDADERRGGWILLHSLRVELVARISTVEYGKHSQAKWAVILGDCIQAAKITVEKDQFQLSGEPDVETHGGGPDEERAGGDGDAARRDAG